MPIDALPKEVKHSYLISKTGMKPWKQSDTVEEVDKENPPVFSYDYQTDRDNLKDPTWLPPLYTYLDDRAIVVVCALVPRTERHKWWPRIFDSNGFIRNTRQPLGSAPLVILYDTLEDGSYKQSQAFYLVVNRVGLLGGYGASGKVSEGNYRALQALGKKEADSFDFTFGQELAILKPGQPEEDDSMVFHFAKSATLTDGDFQWAGDLDTEIYWLRRLLETRKQPRLVDVSKQPSQPTAPVPLTNLPPRAGSGFTAINQLSAGRSEIALPYQSSQLTEVKPDRGPVRAARHELYEKFKTAKRVSKSEREVGLPQEQMPTKPEGVPDPIMGHHWAYVQDLGSISWDKAKELIRRESLAIDDNDCWWVQISNNFSSYGQEANLLDMEFLEGLTTKQKLKAMHEGRIFLNDAVWQIDASPFERKQLEKHRATQSKLKGDPVRRQSTQPVAAGAMPSKEERAVEAMSEWSSMPQVPAVNSTSAVESFNIPAAPHRVEFDAATNQISLGDQSYQLENTGDYLVDALRWSAKKNGCEMTPAESMALISQYEKQFGPVDDQNRQAVSRSTSWMLRRYRASVAQSTPALVLPTTRAQSLAAPLGSTIALQAATATRPMSMAPNPTVRAQSLAAPFGAAMTRESQATARPIPAAVEPTWSSYNVVDDHPIQPARQSRPQSRETQATSTRSLRSSRHRSKIPSNHGGSGLRNSFVHTSADRSAMQAVLNPTPEERDKGQRLMKSVLLADTMGGIQKSKADYAKLSETQKAEQDASERNFMAQQKAQQDAEDGFVDDADQDLSMDLDRQFGEHTTPELPRVTENMTTPTAAPLLGDDNIVQSVEQSLQATMDRTQTPPPPTVSEAGNRKRAKSKISVASSSAPPPRSGNQMVMNPPASPIEIDRETIVTGVFRQVHNELNLVVEEKQKVITATLDQMKRTVTYLKGMAVLAVDLADSVTEMVGKMEAAVVKAERSQPNTIPKSLAQFVVDLIGKETDDYFSPAALSRLSSSVDSTHNSWMAKLKETGTYSANSGYTEPFASPVGTRYRRTFNETTMATLAEDFGVAPEKVPSGDDMHLGEASTTPMRKLRGVLQQDEESQVITDGDGDEESATRSFETSGEWSYQPTATKRRKLTHPNAGPGVVAPANTPRRRPTRRTTGRKVVSSVSSPRTPGDRRKAGSRFASPRGYRAGDDKDESDVDSDDVDPSSGGLSTTSAED